MLDPILITGVPRSGTSLVAGTIHICGAYGGSTYGPTQHNKKGMFENRTIQGYVKDYIKQCGYDPLGQKPLPEASGLIDWTELRQVMEASLIADGYKTGPWYYKEPKICLIWQTFHAAFPEAKWVIVRRRSEDIVFSCCRTHFMKAYKTEEGWYQWVDAHEERFREMHEAGLNIREVWPSKYLINGQEDLSEAKDMINWLELNWNDAEVKRFADPELYNQRGKHGSKSNKRGSR